jgi:mannose/fructose-specific phosphotransferase system component IIA
MQIAAALNLPLLIEAALLGRKALNLSDLVAKIQWHQVLHLHAILCGVH